MMLGAVWITAALLVLLSPGAVLAAAPVTLIVPIRETSAAMADANTNEDLSLSAMFSGVRRLAPVGSRAIVRGVLGGDLAHKPAFPDLYVAGLLPGDRQLCVTLYSPNGSYIGLGRADVSEAASRAGMARLKLETQKAAERRDLPALATAAIVQVASNNMTCTGPMLPAAWSAPPKPGAPVTLLVGSGGRSQMLQARDEAASRGEICVPITGEGMTGQFYGLRCRLAVVVGCPQRRILIETVAQLTNGPAPASGGEKVAEILLRSACQAS